MILVLHSEINLGYFCHSLFEAPRDLVIFQENEADPETYHHYYQPAPYLSYPAWLLHQATPVYQDLSKPTLSPPHRDRWSELLHVRYIIFRMTSHYWWCRKLTVRWSKKSNAHSSLWNKLKSDLIHFPLGSSLCEIITCWQAETFSLWAPEFNLDWQSKSVRFQLKGKGHFLYKGSTVWGRFNQRIIIPKIAQTYSCFEDIAC